MPTCRDCLSWLHRLTPQQFRKALFVLLALTCALFPLGRAFQTLGPLLGLGVLAAFYATHWEHAVLRRLPVKWLFAPFFVALTLQVVLSHWISLSWATVSPNLYRGVVLVFMGLESVASERDLKWLVGACALPAFYMGLDGVWQCFTGLSFLKMEAIHQIGAGTPRLTGSFGGPRTGDYMALLLLPSCALWYVFSRPWRWRVLLTLAILAPGLFLWLGAQARSGYLALFLGLSVAVFILVNRPRWYTLLLPPGILALLIFCGPDRVSLATVAHDGRIPIWSAAWKTFLASPWTGFGAGTFTPAHTLTQGYMYLENGGDIQHPHNAYLQWLTEGGVLTFCLYALFFGGMLVWTFFRIRQGCLAEQREPHSGTFWRLTAFFWAGYAGYLIINAAGHSFYRSWLMSMGLMFLGIVLGACANGAQSLPSSKETAHDPA